MGGNLHRPRKVVGERGLEILAPAGRIGRHSAEGKGDRCESVTRVETATPVKPHLLVIEFVKVMEDAADAIPFVIVERLIVDAHNTAVSVEHQVLADQPARIRKAIRELLVCGKQKQARSLGSVCADHYGLGFLKIGIALVVKINCSYDAPTGVEFDLVNVRARANLAAAGALRHANRRCEGT